MTKGSHKKFQKTRCDACHKPLMNEEDEDQGIRLIEIPYRGAEQLKKKYPELHDELLQKDGRLVFHANCDHPIKELLPTPEKVSDSFRETNGNIIDCPVCNIPIIRSRDNCGRCGHEF